MAHYRKTSYHKTKEEAEAHQESLRTIIDVYPLGVDRSIFVSIVHGARTEIDGWASRYEVYV